MIIALALAGSMVDEVTAAADGGAGAAHLKIYDENGAGVPADLSVAITTQVLLADIVLNDPSFAGFIDAAPGARIVLDVTPEPEDAAANATAGGSPTLFARLEDSNGLEHAQFTVGVGSGDLQINSLAIQTGAAVVVTAGAITMPES